MARGVFFDIAYFQSKHYSILKSDHKIWAHPLPALKTSLTSPRGILVTYDIRKRLVLHEVALQVSVGAHRDVALFDVKPSSDLCMGENRFLMFRLAEYLPVTGWLELGHENFNGQDQIALMRLYFEQGFLQKTERLTAGNEAVIELQMPAQGATKAHASGAPSIQRDLAPDPQVYQDFCRSLQIDLDKLRAARSVAQRATLTLNLIDRIEYGHSWQAAHIRDAIRLWVQQLYEPVTYSVSMRALQLLAMVGHQITPITDYQPLIDWIRRNPNVKERGCGIGVLQRADAEGFASVIASL